MLKRKCETLIIDGKISHQVSALDHSSRPGTTESDFSSLLAASYFMCFKKTDWQVRDFHRGFDFLWFNPQVRNIFLVNVTVFCLISEYVQAAFFKLTVAADRKYLLD
jgi:hypothetical protein